MRASTIIQNVNRHLAYELVGALRHEWRVISHRVDVTRAAKNLFGYVAAVIVISLAVNMILSAPWHTSDYRYPRHVVVNGLHIAVPENLRAFPIEQLVPLP